MSLGPLPPPHFTPPLEPPPSPLVHPLPLPTSQHNPPAIGPPGTTALRSSWIRRLKPREEPETPPIQCGRDPHGAPAESPPGAPLECDSTPPSSRLSIEAGRTPSNQCAAMQPSSEKPLGSKSSKVFSSSIHLESSRALKAANGNQLDNCLNDIPCERMQKTTNLNAEGKADGQVDAPSANANMVTAKATHRVTAGASKPGFGAWINVKARERGEDKKESEEDGPGIAVPADTEIANGKVAYRVSTLSSNSGFGPWKNLSSRGRIEEKLEPISGRTPAQFTRTPLPEAAMDPRFRRPQREDRQKGISQESFILYGGTLRSVAVGPGSMGKPPLPPARTGAVAFSKVGLPPRPRGQKVHGSSIFGSPIKPAITALSAGVKEPLSMVNPLAVHPTQSISSRGGVLDVRDANTGHLTSSINEKAGSSIADTRKGDPLEQLGTCCSPCNYTKSLVCGGNEMNCSVVPSFGGDDCVQTEQKIEERPLTSAVKAFSATPASSQQCKLFSEGQVRKSMPPPASIPLAARQHRQFPGKEQTGATNSLSYRNVGPCSGGKEEHYEKDEAHTIAASPAFQSISAISQPELRRPEHPGPLRDIRAGEPTIKRMGEPKGNLQQQALLKLRSIPANSESESSHGTARSDRAEGGTAEPAASASTTASFPFEMVIEAAGSSKRAREMFVEVYNRARDELKNQGSCQIRGKRSDKEIDGRRRLAFGQLPSYCDAPSRPMSQRVEGHKFGSLQSLEEGASKNKSQSFKMEVKITDSRIKGGDPEQLISKSSPAQGAIHGITGEKVQKHEARPSSNAHQPGFASGFMSRRSSFDMYHGLLVEQSNPSIKTQDIEHKEGLREGYQIASADQKERPAPLAKDGIQIGDDSGNCGLRSDVQKAQGADVCRQDQRFSGNITLQSKTEEKLTEGDLRSDRPSFSRSSTKEGPTFVASNKSEEEISVHLGKRSRQIFEETGVSGCCPGTMGKGSAEKSERPVLRPQIWLQRWQSSAMLGRTMQGSTEPNSDTVTKSANRLCTSMATTVQGTDDGLPNRNLKQNSKSEKKHVLEHPRSPPKVLASAAAMAIVGKSSVQFRPAPPQRKGSIAVWPAFGTSAKWNLDPLKDQKTK